MSAVRSCPSCENWFLISCFQLSVQDGCCADAVASLLREVLRDHMFNCVVITLCQHASIAVYNIQAVCVLLTSMYILWLIELVGEND